VKTTVPTGAEYLHVVTKSGEKWKWKQPTVTDDSVTFEGVTISKGDIRYIFYVRAKPLTNVEEFFHDEDLKWLAPIPWLGEVTRISVLLYNSDLPEDNSSIACR
jgi:hypothetical protein